MRSRPRRGAARTISRAAREIVLCVGALGGIAGIVMAIAVLAFGFRPLVVTSGSMSPTFGTGALVMTRSVEAGDLSVGDVVSVTTPAGDRVTHRIDGIDPAPGAARTLTLRGDANSAADLDAPTVHRAERVVFSVERLGYALTWLTSPGGLVATSGFLLGVLVLGFWPPSVGRRRRHRADRTHDGPIDRRRGPIVVGAAMVSIIVAGTIHGVGSVATTRASWNDRAEASTGLFTAHTVRRPTAAPVCSNEGGLLGLLGYVRLSWEHLDARYRYDYTITRVSDGRVMTTGTLAPSGAVGSTATFDVHTSLLGQLLQPGTDFDVTIRSVMSSAPGWTSPSSDPTRIHTVNLLVGLSMRCGSA